MSNTVAGKIAGERQIDRADSGGLYASDGGRKYLNQAERQRALAEMAALESKKALFALTLAWTGARVSEILALTPASFQIESCIVSMRTLKRRKLSIREVPLPQSLMHEIDQCFDLKGAQLDPVAAHTRLWVWRRETAWRFITAAMHRAGVVGRQACPRGLRHGFGVGTLQVGIPLNLVQRWLGHARISTTAIYANASGPEERAFAARFWTSPKL